MEDTTQSVATEAPEGQAEVATTEGVVEETTTDSPEVTADESPQPITEEDAEAKAAESLFQTLKSQKKWESEEDMARAYAELEKSHSKKSAQAAELEKLIEALIEQPDEPTVQDEYAAPDVNKIVDQRTRPLQARLDVQDIASRHDDFDRYADKMTEILKGVSPQGLAAFDGPKGVELLYKMAKAETLDQEVANAKAEGRKEVTATEVEKLKATVSSGTKASRDLGTHTFTAAEIAKMDDATYMKNRDEILRQQKEGLIL